MGENKAYRALVLRYDITRLPPEVQQKVAGLLRVQEGLRRWASERARSNGKAPLPEENPLRRLAQKLVHAHRALEWLGERVVSERGREAGSRNGLGERQQALRRACIPQRGGAD